MKALYLKILLIALFAVSINAQTDTIIKTNSIICLINKKCFKKNPIFKNVELVNDSVEINKVKSITFIKNDSLHLLKSQSKIYAINLKDLREVSIKSGTHWFTGLALGCLAVGLISAGIAAGMNDFPSGNISAIGIISSVVLCGVIGTIIGSRFDAYETLDLRNVPSADKKRMLLEFIRLNK